MLFCSQGSWKGWGESGLGKVRQDTRQEAAFPAEARSLVLCLSLSSVPAQDPGTDVVSFLRIFGQAVGSGSTSREDSISPLPRAVVPRK